jgi:hypothetical protein
VAKAHQEISAEIAHLIWGHPGKKVIEKIEGNVTSKTTTSAKHELMPSLRDKSREGYRRTTRHVLSIASLWT